MSTFVLLSLFVLLAAFALAVIMGVRIFLHQMKEDAAYTQNASIIKICESYKGDETAVYKIKKQTTKPHAAKHTQQLTPIFSIKSQISESYDAITFNGQV